MGWQTDGLLCNAAPYEVAEALSEILSNLQHEQRTERRVSYFGPVSIGLPNLSTVNLSAFARDISLGGIGLVHLMPLKPREVVVTISLPSGKSVAIRTDLVWCRDYNNGWYASGGRFLGCVDPEQRRTAANIVEDLVSDAMELNLADDTDRS